MDLTRVTPKGTPWLDGPSDVDPLPTGSRISDIPMKNYTVSEVTVKKSTYRKGHVLIVKNKPPATSPADLPVVYTTQTSLTVKGLGTTYPNGFTVIFI